MSDAPEDVVDFDDADAEVQQAPTDDGTTDNGGE